MNIINTFNKIKPALPIVTNRYILTLAIFIVWIGFFDERDLKSTLQQKQKLAELTAKKTYYQQQIAETQNELVSLENNSAALEKFARERYKMKKDGEDLYLIVEDSLSKK